MVLLSDLGKEVKAAARMREFSAQLMLCSFFPPRLGVLHSNAAQLPTPRLFHSQALAAPSSKRSLW